MTTTAINRQVIQRMLAALPVARSKSAESSGSMQDPGYQGGESTAPSAQPQEGTCECSEGSRSEEYSKDLRDISNRWLPGVDKPEPSKANDTTIPSMGDAAKNSPTGEDPSSEEASTKKQMSDPGYQGGETTSPTRYEEKAAHLLHRLSGLKKSGAHLLLKLAAEYGQLPINKAAASLNPEGMQMGSALASQAAAMLEDAQVQDAVAADTLHQILADAEWGAVKTAAYLYGLLALDEMQKAQLERAERDISGPSSKQAAEEDRSETDSEEEEDEEEGGIESAADSSEEADSLAEEDPESTPEEEALLALLAGEPGDQAGAGAGPEGVSPEILTEILGEPSGEDAALIDSALVDANVLPDELQDALTGKMTSAAAQIASGRSDRGSAKTLQAMAKLAAALPGVRQRRQQNLPTWRPKTAREQQIQKALTQFVTELVRRS